MSGEIRERKPLRSPSVKAIAACFGCGDVVAKRVKFILRLSNSRENLVEDCGSYSKGSSVMSAVNSELSPWVSDVFGYEVLQDSNFYGGSYWYSTYAIYINRGETYTPTLLYDVKNQRYIITSWGDFYESIQDRLEKGEY